MPWLVRVFDAVDTLLERPQAVVWNAVIVFLLLEAIAATIDLTRPIQPFDYVRF